MKTSHLVSSVIALSFISGSLLVAVEARAADGKATYESTCAACHTSGVAGAPKLGDKAAWAPRLSAGAAALNASAINGKGIMPPKGGNKSLADADIVAAVDYLLSQSK